MKDLNCLRCGSVMHYRMKEKLQLGQTGWVLGDLPNLLAGAMTVNIYVCPQCGKLEFYSAGPAKDDLPQKKCPQCGMTHDFDYPKCPFCHYDYFK